MRIPRGLNAKKSSINPHNVNRVWSLMPPEVDTEWRFCKTSGSSFIDDGEGGDIGAGAGDRDGSLESERGGVSSPHTNRSRRFCRWVFIFSDIFSAFNFAFVFCKYLQLHGRNNLKVHYQYIHVKGIKLIILAWYSRWFSVKSPTCLISRRFRLWCSSIRLSYR